MNIEPLPMRFIEFVSFERIPRTASMRVLQVVVFPIACLFALTFSLLIIALFRLLRLAVYIKTGEWPAP